MCNLYSHNPSQALIASLLNTAGFTLTKESMGLNIQPGFVGADQNGPVIRWEDNDRELEIAMLRWGFPKVSEKHKSYITNIRNLESSWWKNVNRRYVEDASYRCLVPFDRFSEWDASKRENAWFSVDAEQAYFGVRLGWGRNRIIRTLIQVLVSANSPATEYAHNNQAIYGPKGSGSDQREMTPYRGIHSN